MTRRRESHVRNGLTGSPVYIVLLRHSLLYACLQCHEVSLGVQAEQAMQVLVLVLISADCLNDRKSHVD